MLDLVFFGPMRLVQTFPAAPFVVGVTLLAVQALLMAGKQPFDARFFRQPPALAGLLWLIYGLYELQVGAAWPMANIRLDLLVLTPILYVFSALAVWSIWRQWERRHEG